MPPWQPESVVLLGPPLGGVTGCVKNIFACLPPLLVYPNNRHGGMDKKMGQKLRRQCFAMSHSPFRPPAVGVCLASIRERKAQLFSGQNRRRNCEDDKQMGIGSRFIGTMTFGCSKIMWARTLFYIRIAAPMFVKGLLKCSLNIIFQQSALQFDLLERLSWKSELQIWKIWSLLHS